MVNRKISEGNRSVSGARAQAATTSLVATCTKRGIDIPKVFRDIFRGIQPTIGPPLAA